MRWDGNERESERIFVKSMDRIESRRDFHDCAQVAVCLLKSEENPCTAPFFIRRSGRSWRITTLRC